MKTTFTAPGISATLARRPRAEDDLRGILSEMLDGSARMNPKPPLRTRIAWRALAGATFDLDDHSQWEGELPPGMAQQQFRGRLARQAVLLGGRIGIRVRGRRWSCWPERRPTQARAPRRSKAKNPEVARIMKERGCSRQWAHRILKKEKELAS